MTLLDKIRLSGKYGRAVYVISAILTVAMGVFAVFYPMMIPTFICVKLVSIPVILYLFTLFDSGLKLYFYLNLGISRNEYRFIPLVVEFISFILIMVISGVIGYAIG